MARSPGLAIGLTIAMLSLLGIPPLAGFAGKFQVFEALYDVGRTSNPQLSMGYNVLLGIGVLNTVISAGYYLRIVRLAVLEEPTANEPIKDPPAIGAMVGALAFAIVLVGIAWNPILKLTSVATRMP